MSEIGRMLEGSVLGFAPDEEAGLEATLRLVARRDRHRRFAVALVALALFAGTAVGFVMALGIRQPTSPASSTPAASPVRPAGPVVVPGAAPASGGIALCVAPSPDASECVSSATYRGGDPVEFHIQGRAARRRGSHIQVWSRAPHAPQWRQVDVVEAPPGGQATWTWRPLASGGVPLGRYEFQVRVAHRIASAVVEVQLTGHS